MGTVNWDLTKSDLVTLIEAEIPSLEQIELPEVKAAGGFKGGASMLWGWDRDYLFSKHISQLANLLILLKTY